MARFRKPPVILGLAVGLAALAAVVWREPLVATGARRALAANGFDEARLEVVEVGTGAIVVQDLRLGPGLPEVRRLRLDYAPGRLVSGQLGTLRIEGLRHAAPASLEEALAPLAPFLPGDGGGGFFTLARVEIEDGLITLDHARGGTIGLEGAFDLSGEAPGAALEIVLDLGAATGTFTLRSEALGEGKELAIDGAGQAELTGVAVPGAAGASLTAGLARYTVEGIIRIPDLDAGLGALQQEGVAALTGGLELSGVASSLAPGTLSSDIGWALEAGEGTARLELSRPALLSVAGIPARTLAALGLATPDDAARTLSAEIAPAGPLLEWTPGQDGGSVALATGLALSLGDASAAARATARFNHGADFRMAGPATVSANIRATGLSVAAAGFAGTIGSGSWSVTGSAGPGELALEGPLGVELRDLRGAAVRAAAVSIDGPVRLTGRREGWSLDATSGLALVAEAVAIPGHLRLTGPLALAVATLALDAGGGPARLELRAEAEPVSGVVLDVDAERLAFEDAAGRIGLAATLGSRAAGELTLAGAEVTLPGHAVALSAMTGRLPLGGEGPVALAGMLRDTGAAPRFPPLDVTLDGERSGEAVSFSGVAESSGAGIRLPLEGNADLVGASGHMTVGPTRLAFRRGGLQPRALTSLLPPLADVDGGVRLTADLAFDPDSGLRSSASLDLQDLSLRSGEITVAGLSGRLRLARLAPMVTAGVQELSARSVTAGVPLEGTRARFIAEARGAGIAVHIHEATGGLAGGTVLVEEAHWNSAARSNAFGVRVRDVQLSQLLSDWHIEGISGTGRLSGVIPVRVAPGGVAVDGGQLEAAGPGVIQVDWGSARDTLMNAGEQVALTVRALEDFHYDSLSLGIDQPPDGELTLAIGLEGANPEVLDGHPFRFNINLSGELAPILEAVREGRRIGAGLLRGGLGGQ